MADGTSAAGVFDGRVPDASTPAPDLKALHAKIGGLTLENDFSEGALIKAGTRDPQGDD